MIAGNRELADKAVHAAKDSLEKSGLKCHPVEGPAEELEALGVKFSGLLRGFLPTASRYWRLRQALRAILRRKHLRGDQLEVIMGHVTFFAMLDRRVLSLFSSVYKYIRAKESGNGRLWSSCVDELTAFFGLMPLVRSSWDLEWCDEVVCYDSCTGGRGFVSAPVPLELSRQAGLVSERNRFLRKFGGRAARESAFKQLDPFRDALSVVTRSPTWTRMTESGL